jgi:Kef-type K+ transport system membrane component KefB
MRLLLLSLLLLTMVGVQALHSELPDDVGARAALVFGFLMLAGFILGEILSRWAIPKITGYLVAGMICGPSLLGLVDNAVVKHLRLVDELALALIALTAGGELKLASLKKRARGILTIVVVQTLVVFATVTFCFMFLRENLGIFQGLSYSQTIAVASILGLIATAKSPSTTVAVIIETRSKGQITDTVLGATVLKDIVVLVCFSLLMSAILPYFEEGGSVEKVTGLMSILFEVVLSLVVGSAFGGLMILYYRFVGKKRMLFVIAAAFILISLSNTFHLSALLAAVAAGFVVSNFSKQGGRFLRGLEKACEPVFLIFFCLAGASLNLSVMVAIWFVVLIYVGLRTGFTWVGTWLGAFAAAEPEGVRKYAWTGFIGQAGVSLGLASIVRNLLPSIGPIIADLIVGAIIFNQIFGPIIFRWALIKTGEGKSR